MNLTLLMTCPTVPISQGGDPAVRALLDLMRAHDPALRRHSEGVAGIATAVAAALGVPAYRGSRLRTAALLHDVGKLGVPRPLLLKPGPLTASEYATVTRHPLWGFHIVRCIGLEREARWVLHHHERPDGHGYPHGLRDGEIPLEASVLHVADAFDALITDRPYRAAVAVPAALAAIEAGAETEFDPACVAALAEAVAAATASERP
jgi:HD-GYP domain-containing protein (c-di-GMP phosphodiesterase class II)